VGVIHWFLPPPPPPPLDSLPYRRDGRKTSTPGDPVEPGTQGRTTPLTQDGDAAGFDNGSTTHESEDT
jgi:hypothetical protein